MPTDPNHCATTVENQDITEISVDSWKKQREYTEKNQNNPGNKNSDGNSSSPNGNVNKNNNNNNNSNRAERKPKTVYRTHPVRHVEKQTIPQRIAILEPRQPIDRLPGIEDRKDKIRYQREPIKVTLLKLLKLQPKV